jgi:hypothetical protein
LPKQAKSILKEFNGFNIFSPLCSAESKAGENASPEKRVNVDYCRYLSSKALKKAAPALG